MRIGVLTFHAALNAGAVLQAYALQTYLESLGHNVEFINYAPDHHYVFRRDFLAKSWNMIMYKWRNIWNGIKYRRRGDFNKALHVGAIRYHSYNQLLDNPPIYDLYICGSDQVWHFPQNINPVWTMDFVPSESKIISYAASLGQHFPPEKYKKTLRRSLSKFAGISIREENGVKYIAELFDGQREIVHSVDPTLLLPVQRYEEITEPTTNNRDYIVCYSLTFLDACHYHIINKAAGIFNAEIINLRNPDTCDCVHNANNIITTPYQWLSYIKNAKAVVASSFHAVVFSLIFHKPFICIQPATLKKQGGNSRVHSLLAPIGLEHHCIYEDEGSDTENLLNEPIDWEKVDSILENLATNSKNYLKNYLSC